jgi:hypothetical protein
LYFSIYLFGLHFLNLNFTGQKFAVYVFQYCFFRSKSCGLHFSDQKFAVCVFQYCFFRSKTLICTLQNSITNYFSYKQKTSI